MARPGSAGRAAYADDWNAVSFAAAVARAKSARDFDELKRLLTEVAESNYRLSRSVRAVPRTVPITHDECSRFPIRAGREPSITFSMASTADACLHFGRQPRRVVCALNYANGQTPGGGYKNGSTAQEEDLCRRMPLLYSSLYAAAKHGMYPFGPSTCTSQDRPAKYSDVLCTLGVTVARAGEEDGFAILPPEAQVEVSLIAAAAPNIRFAKEISDPELIYRTINTIFVAPKMNQPDVNTLVLGAWGCGAFGGDPVQIAELFVRALISDNLGRMYNEVHFAIPRGENYDVFREVFAKFRVRVSELQI